MDDYKQGLLDAIAEIDAELECVEIEYADAPPCLKAARRVLTNAKQLIVDKLAIETPGAEKAAIAAAVEAERERCAKLCDEFARVDLTGYGIAEDCAAAIRGN